CSFGPRWLIREQLDCAFKDAHASRGSAEAQVFEDLPVSLDIRACNLEVLAHCLKYGQVAVGAGFDSKRQASSEESLVARDRCFRRPRAPHPSREKNSQRHVLDPRS